MCDLQVDVIKAEKYDMCFFVHSQDSVVIQCFTSCGFLTESRGVGFNATTRSLTMKIYVTCYLLMLTV